jgi:predicted MPP superfamily phosphohydrolase
MVRSDNPYELVGTGSDSWLLRLPGNESFHLWLRDWTIDMPNLPPALDGLRIVQLTDLHLSPSFDRRYFERVAEASKAWEADLILITGDIVEHEDAIPWIEPLLGPLTARLGKFAILGNHDEEHQPRDILRELENAGYETLEGRWTSLEVGDATLAIGGTAYPWGPEPDPSTIPPADFRLLLSHSPDLFYKAERWGVDFMLSGHNHGGQIRLPLVGPIFMPSRYSRRFDRGFFRRRNLLLYVSEGISGLHPIRYGCPPEIASFVLRTTVQRTNTNSDRGHSAVNTLHPNLEADRV